MKGTIISILKVEVLCDMKMTLTDECRFLLGNLANDSIVSMLQ